MRHLFCICLAMICSFVSSASSQTAREVKETIPLAADGLLIIDTYKGSITITTHDKSQVELDVRIEADEFDSRQAEQDVKDTEIDIQKSAAEVSVHTDYDKLERHHHAGFWDRLFDFDHLSSSLPLVHYTIKMPRTAKLEIKDYKSRTHIDGVKSTIELNTYKGSVEVAGLEGGIELETYKGRVRVAFDRLKNDSRFESYKGDITVTLPKENGFDLQTKFGRRVDFSTDFDVETYGRGRNHHHYEHQGTFNGGGSKLEFESEKGNINLRTN